MSNPFDSEDESSDLINRIGVSKRFKIFITEDRQKSKLKLRDITSSRNQMDTNRQESNKNLGGDNSSKSEGLPLKADQTVHQIISDVLERLLAEVILKLSNLNLNSNEESAEEQQMVSASNETQKTNETTVLLSDSEDSGSDKENQMTKKQDTDRQRERPKQWWQDLLDKPTPVVKCADNSLGESKSSHTLSERFVDIDQRSVNSSEDELPPIMDHPFVRRRLSFNDSVEVVDILSSDDDFPNNISNDIIEDLSDPEVVNDSDESVEALSVPEVVNESEESIEEWSPIPRNTADKDNKTKVQNKMSLQFAAKPKVKPADLRRDINEIIDDNDFGRRTRISRKKEDNRIEKLTERLKSCGLRVDNSNVDIDSEDQNVFQHKNDFFNRPNDDGRVVVNIGHSDDEHDVYLAPKIAEKVMAHQIGGIRFLYDNLIESIANFDKNDGFGCVLSHSMGLGKTVQIIAVVDIFLRKTSAETVLIVLPVNVLNNWILEFDQWLPQRNRNFNVFTIDKLNTKSRNREISNWHNSGGVLLIGYEKFLSISSKSHKILQNTKDCSREEISDAKRLLIALEDPGPEMVICDEGHRIKNDDSGISRALKKIKTRRRVILTGYPLQNKLKEYYCMIDFVRPYYLGLKWEFNNSFERPITNGQCKDATDNDKKLMRERSHVLNQLLKGFIQRRTEDVLKPLLPEKQEYVLLCKLTKKQREMIDHYLNKALNNQVDDTTGSISLFRTFVVCSKVCNHPDIIYDTLQKRNANEEIDPESQPQLFAYLWAKDHFKSDYKTDVLNYSNKMVILFDIIEETVANGEKILVFSQWLFTLDLIERFLKSKGSSQSTPNSAKYRTYYRLDGQTKAGEREELVSRFNSKDNKGVHIFLISTKAGGIGINLIGANRIVIFDACWNPCHDAQASCRIYRPGQSKPCFIYRLISENSLEKRIFNKQILKHAMAKGVIDQKNVDLKLNQNEVRALLFELRKELSEIDDNKRLDGRALLRIKDPILTKVCLKSESCLTAVPSELNTYLLENKDLELTPNQKREAVESYQQAEQLNLNLKPNIYRNRSDPDIDLLNDTLNKSLRF